MLILFIRYGTVKNYIEKDCNTVKELREEIINNRFEIKVSKFANIKNSISKLYRVGAIKKFYKERKNAISE